MTHLHKQLARKKLFPQVRAYFHCDRRQASSLFAINLFLLIPMLLISSACMAQVTAGSLSGTVHDSTNAVLPDAKVVLRNEANGTAREAVSNGSGNFIFPAVPSGTCTITVSHAGFSDWQINGIVLDEGENRAVPDIAHKVGSAEITTTVSASTEAIPTDTGQLQLTLSNALVTDLSIQGRDAAELVKVLPGVALNTGLGQSEYSR